MITFLRMVPAPVWWALVALLMATNALQLVANARTKALLANEVVVVAKLQQNITRNETERQQRHATIATLTAEVSEKNRVAEAMASAKAKEIADVVIAEKKRTERAVALARADADRRMRDELAAFAAASAATPDGEAAAAAGAGLSAEGRAIALGGLLASCRAEAIGDAGELEDLATQVRGLINHHAASAQALNNQ